LKIITDGMVRGIKSFAAWSKRSLTPENAKKFLDALSKVGDAIAWIARNAKWLVPTIIGLVVAFEALKVAIVLMNAALIATNVIMAISPVGWIIIGITALIGVLILAYVYWDKITAAISGAWDAMKKWPIIGPVLDALNKFWDWLKTIPVIGDVVKALEGFYKGLLKYMLNPIGTMKDLWDNLVKIMGADFWKQLVKDIEDTGAAIMKWLHKPIAAVTDATHTMMDTWRGRPKWLGGTGGGAAGAAQARAGVQAAAAATAPAQKAAAQIPLAPEGLKAVQDERADIMQEMMRPELRNLISATMATEAGGIEDQKNVMEALVNRAVAAKRAGNYKGIESMIKGGFYGPYNRGETQAVMSKGLTDSRSQQVLGALTEIQQGRNALGGLTDQGMINEIKGAIKEQHGEDYYGMQGLPGEKESAAYKYSQAFREGGQVARAYADGGIASTPQIASLAEQGPEMVLPLRGAANKLGGLASKLGGVGGGTTNHVSFAPNITINGNATDAEQKAMDSRLRDLAKDFISQFKRAQAQERRLSYESGYA
jgi:NAD(P)H-dependent FMN reductase